MPVYFSLEDALTASKNAAKDYKPIFNGEKGKTSFIQGEKSKKIEIEKVKKKSKKTKEDIPPPTPEEDPVVKSLQEKIDEIRRQQEENARKLGAEEPVVEIYKESPSTIRSLAVVEITDRKQVQKLKGAQAVQRVKGQQNTDNWFTRGGAKWAAKQTTIGGQIGTGIVAGTENYIAHPIANLQNMFREPFERRDISFSDRVNLMIKNVIFPNNPELALKLPDEFVEELLKVGQEKRGKKLNKVLSNLKDLMLWNTAGFTMDTQQKRALEYLAEILLDPTDPRFIDLKEKSLAYSANLAHGFALTITDGKDLLPNQKKLGDSQVLLPNESRTEVSEDKNLILQNRIKDEVLKKFFDPASSPPTDDEKLLMIKQINQIYLEEGLINKKTLEENEFANDIVLELEDMLKHKDFFWKKWSEVRFINYTGTSKGEALGGQERFTWNEKLALKIAGTNSKIAKGAGTIPPALAAAAEATTFFGGYIVSGLIGAGKFLPRWAASSKVARAAPFLGPFWSGVYGASTESLDYIGPVHVRESRVVSQQRQVSQAKALGRSAGELDFVRQQLEREATVTPIAAEELTKSILDPLLVEQNKWNSETKDLDAAKILEIFTNIAHARARIEATHKSGSKELYHTTQNWISYHEGSEQKELTDLKAASLQGFSRLMRLQSDKPELFKDVPFYDPTNPASLETTLKAMTEVMTFGFIEGFPLQILDGSPLNGNRSAKFYKQIFAASGISKDEIAQGEKFIELLKDSNAVFGGKKMSEWLDQSESFKERYQSLKKLKKQRAIVTGSVSAAVGALVGLAKQEIQQAQSHATVNQSQPVAAPTPHQMTVEFDNIFKAPKDAIIQRFHIYDADLGKTLDVGVPLAEGFKFLTNSDVNDKNIDIQGPDGTVYDNVFIFDKAHNALVPNDHFVPPGATAAVDLGDVLNFKTEQNLSITNGGQPVELTGGAAIVDYLKTHYREAMSTIAHRDVFKEQHALTTFVDSDGKIHITQGGYSAPNITGGAPQSMTGGLENGDGVLWFTFGENAERTLSENSTPLSFEGIKVPLTWHEKGNGGYGEFIFDPRHPNVDNPQEVLLSKLINTQALDKFQAMGPNNWLNEKELGELWMGIRGYEGGFISQTPDGPKMHDFEMEFAGENNKLTIAPPSEATFTETTTLIPPTPVEIAIPEEPIQPVQPTPTNSTDSTPILGSLQRWYSPQLNPTTGGQPTPVSSTPIPQSIINSSEFKKEKQPDGYTNQDAFDFLNNLPEATDVNSQIDNFIYNHVLNNTQYEFIRSPVAENFRKNLNEKIPHLLLPISSKITNQQQLSSDERDQLRSMILKEGNDNRLTDQEALTISTFFINKIYLDSLHSAIQEKKQLDEELKKLNIALANSTPIPQRTTTSNNPIPTPQPLPTVKISPEIKLFSGEELFNKFIEAKREGKNTSKLEGQLEKLENIVFPDLLGTKLNEEILNSTADPDHKL